MWSYQNEKSGTEVSKCRHRIVSYLSGRGLDLGCGDEKIVHTAIGIDARSSKGSNLIMDLSANDPLSMFSDNHFDYIFSSHLLEDFIATEAVLDSWWRKIKPGGYLILYCPDADYYPRVGTPGSNTKHRKDLYWQDVWKILKKFGNAKKITASRHNDSNEYSWLLVVQKKFGFLKKPLDVIKHAMTGKNDNGKVHFPREKVGKKECLVIRYGAIGDAIWATPVVRQLKKEGYYIVYNCTPYSAQVLRGNPNIDEFLVQERDAIPNENLGPYWKTISEGFDKVVNLSQSVERTLLVAEGMKNFKWSKAERHKKCNVNYQDRTMEAAGYPDIKGERGELYFTEIEKALAKSLMSSLKDRFVILWALSGSSFHKIYPWATYVSGEMNQNFDDIVVITVGDYLCKILEWQLSNTINRAGVWTIRQSMALTKYADLVIGPETGILNAASCYDTNKIVFLSHSTEENLTKYWTNCTSMTAKNCRCYPCHRLMYTNCCPQGPKGVAASCSERLEPQDVYDNIMKYYKPWKEAKEAQIASKKKIPQYKPEPPYPAKKEPGQLRRFTMNSMKQSLRNGELNEIANETK
jgi:ADP-heptose:LPS heptosyltransferase